ncbi:MAG: ribosome-associated translation inhibitor RaiA [Rickettsiales bacterium]|jgi:ribosomal subunit interface protein|nr:ribosome-associated translation inhibitor RaiA [Rickettsiales bacterium]
MHIKISGHHMSNSSALNSFVETKLSAIADKYFKNAVGADVLFLKERNEFIASLRINNGTGDHHIIKSNASSYNVYASFNIALGKLESQLNKTHSKICSHKNKFIAKIKRQI